MARKFDLAPFPPFDPSSEPSSLGQRWKNWTKRFQVYLTAMNITDDKQRRALLLYQAGPATQDIFETLADTGDDYKTALEKLDAYFLPKKNVDYEIFQFWQAVQQPSETIDQFVTRLRQLAAHCEFQDVDKELKSAIIQNCQSKCLRRYALREEALTLDNLLAKARSLDASELQATGIEKSLNAPDTVNCVQQKSRTKLQLAKPHQHPGTCRQCGLPWPHMTTPCPAKGKTCRDCGKANHFAKMCRSKPRAKPQYQHYQPRRQQNQSQPPPPQHRRPSDVRHVSTALLENSSSSDDEYLYAMNHKSRTSKVPKVSVKINDVPVEMIIDTGSSTDILDEDTYHQINHRNSITLQPTTKRLFAYGSKLQLNVLGRFDATIAFKDSNKASTIRVVQGSHGSLLSYNTATELGILDICVHHIADNPSTHESLSRQYPSLFHGIGKLKGVEVKLHINPTVQPVAQQARRIPFHLRKKVEKELEHLEQQGIIEKVDGLTPWVSPLVVIPKKWRCTHLCRHENGKQSHRL